MIMIMILILIMILIMILFLITVISFLFLGLLFFPTERSHRACINILFQPVSLSQLCHSIHRIGKAFTKDAKVTIVSSMLRLLPVAHLILTVYI